MWIRIVSIPSVYWKYKKSLHLCTDTKYQLQPNECLTMWYVAHINRLNKDPMQPFSDSLFNGLLSHSFIVAVLSIDSSLIMLDFLIVPVYKSSLSVVDIENYSRKTYPSGSTFPFNGWVPLIQEDLITTTNFEKYEKEKKRRIPKYHQSYLLHKARKEKNGILNIWRIFMYIYSQTCT